MHKNFTTRKKTIFVPIVLKVVRDRAHTTYPERGEGGLEKHNAGTQGGGGVKAWVRSIFIIAFSLHFDVLTEFAHRNATHLHFFLALHFGNNEAGVGLSLFATVLSPCQICDDCGPAEQNLSQCFFIDSLFCSIRCVLFY